MALYLSEADIRRVLTMPMAIEAVEQGLAERARGKAFDTPRVRTRLPGGHLHILQAAAPELNAVGYKAYYLRPGRSRTSHIHLIDREEGFLDAILEADFLGRVRTGAATGVAVRHLAHRAAAVVGVFGHGRQATTQVEAILAVRAIREIKVHGRDAEGVRAFCESMSAALGANCRPAASARETVEGSDIVVTITRAETPLFDGDWLEAGQLVAAAGSNALDRREIDARTVERAARIVVDSRDVARNECGDLLPAYEAGLIDWAGLPELGEVIVDPVRGRGGDDQIVLFESHGMALQDVYTGVRVLAEARRLGLGTELPIS